MIPMVAMTRSARLRIRRAMSPVAQVARLRIRRAMSPVAQVARIAARGDRCRDLSPATFSVHVNLRS
jgi:hypothetical protein